MQNITENTGKNSVETFELVGNDRIEYFEMNPDVEIEKGDRVILTLNHSEEWATYVVVPENDNPANFPATDDDYNGVILFLIEHDYSSEAVTAARKSQLGL